ncbi:uncharacterized protein LAESUDRAFT_714056 [Laetiporus sulphureus 93-53]|uniref:Uncharacterized protein n=1 Tax=Laetiporus sulphureus 93-53 TaxID=1314785 RepID=A0A165EFF2_9APHY|nr:uncharacterized protein LAESUDRAFT_714056 [Laetiporus sulphureus 93-53]KZT06941.1 hypothetical protein LAESUDRAFT_714056 [Laetiporus sulphureus 93-53]
MAQPRSSHQCIKDESDEECLPVEKLKSSHRNNEHVNEILRGLKNSFVAKISQTDARKEVHQTFRSNCSNVKEGQGGSAMKFNGRVPTERRQVPDGMILKMKENIVPNQHELLQLQDHGLGVIDLVGGIFFSNMWGPASMHVFLRGLLPKLFSHFAKSDPWVMSINKEDDEEIRMHQLPYKESQIFITPHQAIDENVYELLTTEDDERSEHGDGNGEDAHEAFIKEGIDDTDNELIERGLHSLSPPATECETDDNALMHLSETSTRAVNDSETATSSAKQDADAIKIIVVADSNEEQDDTSVLMDIYMNKMWLKD